MNARFRRIHSALLALGGILIAGPQLWAQAQPPVKASDRSGKITLDNGIIALTIDKQRGDVPSIRYMVGGKTIEMGERRGPAMYLDWNGGPSVVPPEMREHAPHAGYGRPGGHLESVRIVSTTDDMADVALVSKPYFWFPFEVEYHFVLPRAASGFYAYAIYRHRAGMPAASIGQTRFVIKGREGTALFTNHVVDDKRRGPFPTSPVVETVQDTTYRLADGSVYTKYDNSAFTRDYLAHGMTGHGIGIWMVWPSTEFCNGGPIRQDLTVHEEDVLLAMFESGHFGAPEVKVADNENWTHIYGPVFIYLNHEPSQDALWSDAKARAHAEQAKWPYRWLHNDQYPLERGTVSGTIKLTDGHSTQGAWAILAPPAPAGKNVDWAQSSHGYMFWSRVDSDGHFSIAKVRPGTYDLFVSGADQPVDFKKTDIKVAGGEGEEGGGGGGATDLGTLSWTPTTHGRTLWQIGKFDRSTDEYMDGANPRNYFTFMHYFQRFPEDVTFTIGQSHELIDWYYAQWNWYNRKPVWTIRFNLDKPQTGKATLTLGLASVQAHNRILVAVNGKQIADPGPKKSGMAGYRSGSCDSVYNLIPIEFDASLLKAGTNEITLGHSRPEKMPTGEELKREKRPPGDIMYDAIRLEVAP